MVFGIDDILEGVAIADVLYFIGEAIFGAEALAAGSTAISDFLFALLSEDGVEALKDIAMMANGNLENSTIVDLSSLEVEPEIEKFFIWEESPEINKIIPKKLFNQKLSIILNNLKKNGVDTLSKEGSKFFKNLIKKTIQLGSSGVKKSLDPKILIPSVIGGIGANKLFFSMKDKAELFNKKKSNLDILKELRKKKNRL